MSDRNPTTALIVGAAGIGLEFVPLQTERVERVYATYRNPQSELLAISEPARAACRWTLQSTSPPS